MRRRSAERERIRYGVELAPRGGRFWTSESAFALEIRRAIESATGRAISRGAFYTTLDRLGQKGLVSWESQVPPNARRELAQRRYAITPAGMRALEETKAVLAAQWQRLADATGEV